MRQTFGRAVERAGITTGDVTIHVLRHTAITRMIDAGIDDHTVKETVGHLTQAMLQRYTYPERAKAFGAGDVRPRAPRRSPR